MSKIKETASSFGQSSFAGNMTEAFKKFSQEAMRVFKSATNSLKEHYNNMFNSLQNNNNIIDKEDFQLIKASNLSDYFSFNSSDIIIKHLTDFGTKASEFVNQTASGLANQSSSQFQVAREKFMNLFWKNSSDFLGKNQNQTVEKWYEFVSSHNETFRKAIDEFGSQLVRGVMEASQTFSNISSSRTKSD